MATLTISKEDEKRVKALGFLSNKGTDNFSARIITVNGKITSAQQKCIGEAAELFGNGTVTFTTRLTVEVPGIPYEKIGDFRKFISKEGLVTGGTGAKVRPIVSCKGTTCQYGRIDSFELSEEIHERFYNGYRGVKLPHKFKIAVGGCPNNCIKPNLNDVGIIGQYIPSFNENNCRGCKKCVIENLCPISACKVEDGTLRINEDVCKHCGRCVGQCPFNAIENGTYGYKIYVGGRWGKKISHGITINKIFTDKEEALDVIEKVILLYRQQGKIGERLASTIERLGFENVQKQLLSNNLLERKEKIINEEIGVVEKSTC